MEKVDRPGELPEALAPLPECLDDLDAAHILHQGGIHLVARAQVDGHLLLVPPHHAHGEHQAQGDGNEGGQPHPPVQNEHQDDAENRPGQVGGQLRHHVAMMSSSRPTLSTIKVLKVPEGVSSMTPMGTFAILSARAHRMFFRMVKETVWLRMEDSW